MPEETAFPAGSNRDHLIRDIQQWGRALGFQQIGFSGTELGEDEKRLQHWLQRGHHGEMAWMAMHGTRRSRPQELISNTLTVISARMDYLPANAQSATTVLADTRRGFISRYALGRDYHKVLRKRLQKLADRIEREIGAFGYRVFTDSAPVLERALARNAGLGWIGKHTNLINMGAGSWFFLGEIYTDLELATDSAPGREYCGSCTRCISACPTGAITAPWQLDARRCISYLTIELQGSIPVEYRPLIGNRIFGCDDCQLVCPWNRYARLSAEADFRTRYGLDSPSLVELFSWDEDEFLRKTEGSAIRRIDHIRWLRNIAVALGNGPPDDAVIAALRQRLDHASELVREHVSWALDTLHVH